MKNSNDELPEVMGQAAEDLCGNISGQFSPADWERILQEAKDRMLRYQGDSESVAWQRVVREFHQERYWGFAPSYRPPRTPAKKWNLGVSFIILLFLTMTITIMAVVWLGQNYASSEGPTEGLLLGAVLAIALGNFAHFLWRNRNHQD